MLFFLLTTVARTTDASTWHLRAIHSLYSIVSLTVLILLTVFMGGCTSAERQTFEQTTDEVLDDRPGLIPLTAFASLPRVQFMALSPSGTHVASIQNVGDKTYLVITTHDGKDRRILFESDNAKYFMRWFDWVNDARLLIGGAIADTVHGTTGPFRWTQTRLVAINRDGSQLATDLVQPTSDVRGLTRDHSSQFQDNLIGMIPGDDRHVLLALDLKHATYPDVYKLDVYTGSLELIERSTYGIRDWMADRQGVVRVGIAAEGTMIHILVKPPGEHAWRTLKKFDARNESGMTPLGFDEDPTMLFVRQELDGRAAIYRINIAQPNTPPTLFASHPRYDIASGIIYSSWLKKVVGARYHTDDSTNHYWDADAAQIQTRINLALPGRFNIIYDSSRDGRRHIVLSSHATQPSQWYLMDEELNRLNLMAENYPELPSKELVKPTPVSFTARDGTAIEGYLTRPVRKPGRLPMVLLPHGGPGTRDTSDFDYWTQFLVSRGWAVLQVNFRGSAGYGTKFLEAGFERWGLDMQDDLTDAVQYAIERRIADPDRICIVGGSYGGYAALMGVVKTPDLYRCAVSLAGVSDLISFMKDSRRFLYYELRVERQLGSWWSDRERLKATSPVNHADKIRTPLLIAHGKEDQTVPVEQSREMVEALTHTGFTQFRYIELPDGDHHLSRREDRIRFFREMERFLSTHLDQARPGADLGSAR